MLSLVFWDDAISIVTLGILTMGSIVLNYPHECEIIFVYTITIYNTGAVRNNFGEKTGAQVDILEDSGNKYA